MNRALKIGVAFLVLLTAIFAALWFRTAGDYPVERTVAEDDSLPYIEVDGYRFHGETFGDPSKPVVMVLHGGPGWDYRSLLPLKALADDYFVVFYDQRGSGLSPRVPASDLSLTSTLRDLDTLVDKFADGRRVILIGHSWGAMLASAYLGAHPDKISHVVLAEPGFLTNEMLGYAHIHTGPRWEIPYMWFATNKWFASLHIDGPDEEAAGDYFLGEVAPVANPEYYCGGTLPPSATMRWRAGATAMQATMASAINADGDYHFDFTQGVENFTRPVLFLASECNSLIGVEFQKRQQQLFANSRLEVISNSGHMIFAEQPEQAISAIRRYLVEM